MRTSLRAVTGPGPVLEPALGAGASPRSGTERRDLRSMRSRWAVFLPTPGTRQRAPTSSSATTRASAIGEWTDKMASASAGPTPWAPRSASKLARSSRLAKPYNVTASSRWWWCTQQNTSWPTSPREMVVVGLTSTR